MLVWVTVSALVLLRQPHAILRPQFIWEEAAAFWASSFTLDPLSYLIEPWAGYLQVIPRAAFLVARLGPPEIAPAVTVSIQALIIGAVAAFLASDRLADAIPDERVRIAFGMSLGFLPFAEAYLSVLSAQWFLAIFLAGLSLSPSRRSDYPVIALAALSGIAAVLALPLFWRDRRGMVLLACAAIQGVVVLLSGRVGSGIHVELVSVVLALTVALAIVVARGLQGLRGQTVLAFGYMAVATLCAASLAFGTGGRYALASAAVIALVAIAATLERRPAGIALAALSVALVVTGWPLPKVTDTDWNEHARCIGGPTPCVVPMEPVPWSVHWDPGDYRSPRMGPDAMPVR